MLAEEIKRRMFAAMKAKDNVEKEILRVALGEITARGEDATDDAVVVILKKLVKSNEESLAAADNIEQRQVLEREIGDFVLLRADGQFAYQLAVVVDDAEQGVTDVVRGADLLDSTPRQIYLQRSLGYATPRYLHVPAAVNAAGDKLSKQTGARPVNAARKSEELRRALVFLGQPESEDLAQALKNWQPSLIPARRVQVAEP